MSKRQNPRGKWLTALVVGIAATCGLCGLCGMVESLLPEATPTPAVARLEAMATLAPPTAAAQRGELRGGITPLAAAIAPTETSTLIPEPTATRPTEPTATTEPATPEPARPVARAESRVNLRGGPGTGYEIVGEMLDGESWEIVGRNSDSSWWQVSTGEGLAWVAAEVVKASEASEAIPVVEAPPVPTATQAPTPLPAPIVPTSTPVPAVEPTATPVPVVPAQPAAECDCSGDLYNCKDFGSWAEAQGCFEHCQAVGAGDIHGLDRDNDQSVCEGLR